MKPSFALNFTDDSVALLHRTKRGWLEVGRSAYDTPDLPEAMAYMRSTALGLAPQGVTAKLVIPASQVRYFDIEAPGPSDNDRRAQIATALDGRTAYAVDDLAFDWSGTGPTLRVAVVARETLAEAEAFALSHRFTPLSFVALPEDGTFAGEPWFGLTEHASSALAGGDTVEKDAEAITILSRALPRSAPTVGAAALAAIDPHAPTLPVNDPAPEPAPEPAPPPEPAPAPVVEPDPIPDPAPRPMPDPVTEPTPLPEPDPVPEPVPATVPEPAPELPDPEPLQIPQPDVTPPDVTPDPAPDLPPAEMPGFDPVSEPLTMQAPSAPAAASAADPDEAPIALDVEDEDPPATRPAPKPRAMPTNVTENSLPPDDESAVPAGAFSSRRVPALAGATAAAAQNMARRLGAASRTVAAAPAAVPRSPKFGFPEQAEPAPPRPPVQIAAQPPAKPVAAPPTADKITVKIAPQPTGAPPPAAPAARVPRPATAAAPRKGPRSLTAPVRGKPRYLGLVLTGLLLVALALAAAVSSYYSASSDTAEPASDTVALASNTDAPAAVPSDPGALPSVDDEMLADGQDIDAGTAPAMQDVALQDVAEPAAAQPAAGAPATAPAMQAATTGNDEIYLSSADIAPSAVDAAALPQPQTRGDPPPDAPLPPPAFGTVYKFDANGLIVPTPEGIVTPEGVKLTAGKPPVVPPTRPVDLAPPPAAAPAADQTQAFPADPALLGKRPAPRPAALAAAPQAEAAPTEEASLAPQAESRLSGIRPQPRPASIAAAPAAAQSPSTLALVTPEGAVSPLGGLALSPRPVARPSAIASAVEAAVAAAQQPDPAPEAIPAAAEPAIVDDGNVTPETEQEPQLASAAPSIPTKANVAKEATERNALNLSKINLIGVYGSQSNRYALIRQPNGRIVKVSVGDRIDGGRVAAVTDGEVRYEKRGKMVVLAMPRG